MPRYRPLKEGTRVLRVADGKQGVVRSVASGHAVVRFQDGTEHSVFLSLLKRLSRPANSGRKKRVPTNPTPVRFASVFQQVVSSRMKHLSFTFETLAVRASLSKETLHRILSGEYRSFRVSTLEAIAAALGISPREFWSPAEEVSSAPPQSSDPVG